MNIAIIGTGYVGCAVAQYWQQKMTFIVTATTTTPERASALQALAERVVVVEGDDSQGIKSVLDNQDVVLLAVGAKSANTYEQSYLHTAQTLVPIIKQSSVKQLIYTSSCSVYGEQHGLPVNEETTVAPDNEKGRILCETEEVLLTAATEKLNVCILRLGGIYGPGRELVKIYSRIAGTTRPGNGEEPVNWIHLDDIVSAIEFARKHQLQGIYNLVDDAELTNREIIEQVCRTHNLPPVTWDATQISNRPYNAKILNQKIKDVGYKLIHPQMIF